jgi:hypothetical protein
MLYKKGRREREEQQDRENFESKIFKRGKTGSEKTLHTLQALLK